jgi:type II secretory pathway pseudopilin PulG
MAPQLLYGNYKYMSEFSTNRAGTRGFTLVDVMAAVLVIALSLGALFTANSRAMGLLKSAKQAAVASKCLQQRIEQIRNYNWTQVTDATAMQDLYSTPPLPSAELPGFSEQVTVSAFTPSTTSGIASAGPSGSLLQITRDNGGTVTLVSDSGNLDSQPTVRVNVQITWPGPGGTWTCPGGGLCRMRETSVIIANGGIGR